MRVAQLLHRHAQRVQRGAHIVARGAQKVHQRFVMKLTLPRRGRVGEVGHGAGVEQDDSSEHQGSQRASRNEQPGECLEGICGTLVLHNQEQCPRAPIKLRHSPLHARQGGAAAPVSARACFPVMLRHGRARSVNQPSAHILVANVLRLSQHSGHCGLQHQRVVEKSAKRPEDAGRVVCWSWGALGGREQRIVAKSDALSDNLDRTGKQRRIVDGQKVRREGRRGDNVAGAERVRQEQGGPPIGAHIQESR
mmetsp:Transcript_2892/g.8828  ORF Transcript_2892/g.8828 Transcript_2892/m.8828 type:complete len:251 (-) Transcript_2892:733-1485(-)